MNRGRLLTVLVLGFLLIPEMGLARFKYKKTFVTTYPETQKTKLDKCLTCHANEEQERNAYGLELELWLKNNPESPFEDALHAVEDIDSDEDTFTNIQEIQALTYPGDINDIPEKDDQ